MLSCLLNNQRINCFDGIYSKEQLKKWASKKILLCPACGKPYEYCHGKVKSPYFRHMDKEQCKDKYSEPETEEHLNGKRDLYEWIKKQQGVTNVILEGWIPETKQRPDIMFKYYGKQCVIEYQCTPIASEYYERHELYQAAGIKDIWILGTEKYFTEFSRKKHIQNVAIGHYSSKNKEFILYEYTLFYNRIKNNHNKLNISFYGNHNTGKYFGRNIDEYVLINLNIQDKSFDNLENIYKKRDYRKSLITKPRSSNTYLNMQKRINLEKQNRLEEYIQNKLIELSNDNWNFFLQYTHNKYNYFCYICAIPRVNVDLQSKYKYEYEINKLNKTLFVKIKVWKLDSEKIYCDNGLDYLKNILLVIMKRNKDILLQYDFRNFRVLEVKK